MKKLYENELPSTVIDRERRREVEKAISRNLTEIKKHWKALQSMPDIAHTVQTIDEALDGQGAIDIITQKIYETDMLPLPYEEKQAIKLQWDKMLSEVEEHCEELNKCFDFFPLGYVECPDGTPDSLCVKPKFYRLIVDEKTTIEIPDEAKELYQEWLKVVEAAENFEKYQFNHNLNVRDAVSCFQRIRNAEDFANNWLKGTWKRFEH